MSASEHLGRQFLNRHLVEHHGWQEEDLDNRSEESSNFQHDWAHKYGDPDMPDPHEPRALYVPHSHSPEKIEFH